MSVDEGCAGVVERQERSHRCRPQQYPLLMASLGVAAVVKYAKGGKKVSGYTDTGVNLIAKKAVAGVRSKSVATAWPTAGVSRTSSGRVRGAPPSARPGRGRF